MEEQQEGQQEERMQGMPMCCPVCGEPGWAPRGPWGMKHKGPWGMGYGGMGYGWPWGHHRHHRGYWGAGPGGMMCPGIVPAMLGFFLGYMAAGARKWAMYGWACEEKRKH